MKVTNYNRYKAKADLLDELLAVLSSGHPRTQTFHTIPGRGACSVRAENKGNGVCEVVTGTDWKNICEKLNKPSAQS